MTKPDICLFTIGHSNLSLDAFVHALTDQNPPIATVVDVRSSPYSRFAPQFNRERLAADLQERGIAYRFAGEYLGGRPTDPTCYVSGQVPDGKADYLSLVNYPEVASRPWFQQGLGRLVEIAANEPTAIMCSEEDPEKCHRHHLIAKALVDRGIEVRHIRKDGSRGAASFRGQALQAILF